MLLHAYCILLLHATCRKRPAAYFVLSLPVERRRLFVCFCENLTIEVKVKDTVCNTLVVKRQDTRLLDPNIGFLVNVRFNTYFFNTVVGSSLS